MKGERRETGPENKQSLTRHRINNVLLEIIHINNKTLNKVLHFYSTAAALAARYLFHTKVFLSCIELHFVWPKEKLHCISHTTIILYEENARKWGV